MTREHRRVLVLVLSLLALPLFQFELIGAVVTNQSGLMELIRYSGVLTIIMMVATDTVDMRFLAFPGIILALTTAVGAHFNASGAYLGSMAFDIIFLVGAVCITAHARFSSRG